MGHIQHERLPKSKMASSDNRVKFKIVHLLRNNIAVDTVVRAEAANKFSQSFYGTHSPM